MVEENKIIEPVEDTSTDYIEALTQLKQNSVDRSKYDALRAENKKLINSIVNGTTVEVEQPKSKADIQALRNELFNDEPKSNLEYITKALELRDALIENGEEDPFVASSSQYTPDANDYARATKVATVLQEMVDVADGDPNVFLNEYQRRVKEVNIPKRK